MFPSPLNIFMPSRAGSKEMFLNGEGDQVSNGEVEWQFGNPYLTGF